MNKPKLVTNPERLGCGGWFIIHLLSKHATTSETKNNFIDFMYLLSVEFPCGKCRGHIQEYLRNHPFDSYLNLKNEKGEDIGMFKWGWLFHNAVNERLNKIYVDWDTAWEMYDTGREVCTNCSGTNSANYSSDENIKTPKNKKKTMIDKKAIIQGYFLRKGK